MNQNRKLSTILFTDIAGYTALMQSDEKKALQFLEHFKNALEKSIPEFGGQIIQYFGDAALCTFDSAVSGVDCALELQKVFIGMALPVRIGMHLGDVVFTSDNVFGDGVNIASRIESMGVAGSVLFSGTVATQLKNQGPYEYESLGKFLFKNVDESTEVYALNGEGIIVPRRKELHGKFRKSESKLNWVLILGFISIVSLTLFWLLKQTDLFADPDKSIPRLAILNFQHTLSPQEAFLVDGIVSELNTRLVGLKNLEVISRSSMENYQNTTLSAQMVGSELNADYILEGKVEKFENDRFVVTPTLINVAKNTQEWTSSFKSTAENFQTLQRDLIIQVLKKLDIIITSREEQSLANILTDNHLAYEAFLKGKQIHPPGHGDEKDFRSAYSFYKQALSLDPKFAQAWLELGTIYMDFYWYGYEPLPATMDTALAKIRRAQSLMSDYIQVKMKLGDYHYRLREYDQSLKYFSEVISERPNDSRILQYIAELWRRQGLFEEAIEYMEKGLALDPLNHNIVTELSWTNIFLGNYSRSLELNDLAKMIKPNADWNHLMGAMIHWSRGANGDLEAAKKLLVKAPDPRSSYPAWFWINQLFFEENLEAVDRLIKNLQGEAIELQHSWEPKSLLQGLSSFLKGNQKQAKEHFLEAKLLLEKKIDKNPTDFRLHISLGLAYAGLGVKQKAIASGQKSLELLPLSKDHLLGLDVRYGMMRIYAILGENEQALDLMSELLSVPCQYSGFFFTKNLEFKQLWGTERFEDLIDKQKRIQASFNQSIE